ncbi:hypothetical protein INT44_006945 [Umbelopsis vinacea]|uniref:Uncharacterized protein n=1 Tax=Umbelopsis vinacea TaxID=44442 RepID=A0A8H7U7R7_9FUNG|nr:hypothetical protein INT44_006945 [Umbelopsis vinacea]
MEKDIRQKPSYETISEYIFRTSFEEQLRFELSLDGEFLSPSIPAADPLMAANPARANCIVLALCAIYSGTYLWTSSVPDPCASALMTDLKMGNDGQ